MIPSRRTALAGPLALVLASLATAQTVTPPPGWVSGDVHEMIQLCQVGGVQPPDRSLADVVLEMQQKGMNVMDVLVLVTGMATCQEYLTKYAPLVTGMEHPLTQGDSNHVLQIGVEVVGGPDPGCLYPGWGHIASIGADNGAYLFGADYPAPNLDFFRAQPKALAGYAHVSWPLGTRVPDDFPPIDRNFTRLYPLLAPFDVALGRVDFFSTPDVGHVATTITPHPWWGFYYKMLDVGQRVSLTAGTVAQCYIALGTLDARTWADIQNQPLSHDAWLAAIRAGRTSISEGGEDFLRLTVDGQGSGSQLYLSSPAQVSVTAELTTSVPRQTTLEIVQNGVVVASEPVQLASAGTHVLSTTLSVPASGWIAARTTRTHTGAIQTFVDARPIVDAATAEYLRAFADEIDAFLDTAIALCNACTMQPCFACEELDRWVGTSRTEIKAELAQGERVYRALRDYASPPPAGVTRYGVSTPSCRGPLGIGIENAPVVGRPLSFTCFNAPPESGGALVIGRSSSTGTPYRGAQLFVGQVPPPAVYMTSSDPGGFAAVTIPVPPSAYALDVYAQFLFDATAACPAPGAMVASDALRIQLPRSLFFAK